MESLATDNMKEYKKENKIEIGEKSMEDILFEIEEIIERLYKIKRKLERKEREWLNYIMVIV